MILVDSLDEKIRESLARDAILVKEALESGFEGREKRLSLTVLEGKDATPEAVLKYYSGLKVGPSDTVLFYFSGHGAVDRARGHVLVLGEKLLWRSDVQDAIKGTKPRLAICLTDCCAGYGDELPEVPREVKVSWATVESLLFRHQGVVDINACSIGESRGAIPRAHCSLAHFWRDWENRPWSWTARRRIMFIGTTFFGLLESGPKTIRRREEPESKDQSGKPDPSSVPSPDPPVGRSWQGWSERRTRLAIYSGKSSGGSFD